MAQNTNGHGPSQGLRILIVGAGIGGLVAAIALRQQGHHVEVKASVPSPNDIALIVISYSKDLALQMNWARRFTYLQMEMALYFV